MARRRPGRPRKLERRKKSARAAKKAENALPPVEGMIRRLEADGLCVLPPTAQDPDTLSQFRKDVKEMAAARGLLATSIDHPLDVLHVRGDLEDGERDKDPIEAADDRHHAGARFAWLWWRRYGKPFGRAIDTHYADGEPPPILKRPDGWESLSEEQRQLWYAMALRWMERALERAGREVRHVVVSVACMCQPPSGVAALGVLRKGLSALARVRMPDPRTDVPDPAIIEDEARRRFEALKRG